MLIADSDAGTGRAMARELVRLGFAIAGPFGSNLDALEYSAFNSVDLAILNSPLSDGPPRKLARALHRDGVRLVFVSSDEDQSCVDGDFPDAVRVDGRSWLQRLLDVVRPSD